MYRIRGKTPDFVRYFTAKDGAQIIRLSPPPPEKKPVFDLGQKQVSFYFRDVIFPEAVK